MSVHKSYGVFGLGRYGMAVAMELAESGAEVLAVDCNSSVVNHAATQIPLCKCGDTTDKDVITKLGVSNLDVVIVAMAEHFEACLLTVSLCKEAGVPLVIAKCGSEIHREILYRVGADKVILPEKESGKRLAKNLLTSGFADMIELSSEFAMLEMDVKEQWVGKNLAELSLRRKYTINVVAIRKENSISTSIDPAMPLTKDMKLVVLANKEKLGKIKN